MWDSIDQVGLGPPTPTPPELWVLTLSCLGLPAPTPELWVLTLSCLGVSSRAVGANSQLPGSPNPLRAVGAESAAWEVPPPEVLVLILSCLGVPHPAEL